MKITKVTMIAAVLQKHQTPLEIIKVPKVEGSSLGRNEVLIQGKYTNIYLKNNEFNNILIIISIFIQFTSACLWCMPYGFAYL